MARFMQNGWPVGTLCVVKNIVGVDVKLRGKVVEVVRGLHWSEQFEREGYLVDEVVNRAASPRWFCWTELLEFRSFPVTLQNWARNRISLLFEVDSRIAHQLGEEKHKGTGEGNYERCYSDVPLGDNDAKK